MQNVVHHKQLNHTVITELVDPDDVTTPLACEARREFEAATADNHILAASGYVVILVIDSTIRAVWIGRAENHFEAFGRVSYSEPLHNGDTGECVVAGPCGLDNCVCEGDPYVMRWEIAAYCTE
jgi:hypothetical protein